MGSISISAVHELSIKHERWKTSGQSQVSNPGPLGEKRKRYLCAMQPPCVELTNKQLIDLEGPSEDRGAAERRPEPTETRRMSNHSGH